MSRVKYCVRNHLTPSVAPLSTAIGLALSAGSLQAATITVTTLNDGSVPGQCTLRDALAAAATDGVVAGCGAGLDADDIVFQPGLSGAINLTGGSLSIASQVSITGPGPDQLSIVGDGTDRLIATALAPVAISGLRLENGYVNDIYGGAAIIATSSDLRLSDCEIVGNTSGSASYGGAVMALDSDIELDQCTLSGNTADGSILLRGGTVGFGGGVLAFRSQVTITDSTFQNNEAVLYGGGLALINSTATIATSSFSGNDALVGGAISLGDYSSLTMSDSLVTENTAFGGGGLVVGSQSEADLTNTELYGNSATDSGAGALIGVGSSSPIILGQTRGLAGRGGLDYSLTGPGQLQLADSYVAFNSTESSGGGITAKYDSTVQVIDSDIAYNQAVSTALVPSGGAFGRGGGTPSGGQGGGLAVLDGAYAQVTGSYLRSNLADLGGGGFAGYGRLLIETSLISSNEAAIGAGLLAGTDDPLLTPVADPEPQTRGGPGPSGTGEIGVYSSLIFDNEADYGGGMAAVYGGLAGIVDSSISDNTALAGGGGLASYASTLTVISTLIADNTAYEGGGVFTEGDDSSVLISATRIRGNDATYAGGLFLDSDLDRLKYSLVDDNSATIVGGVFMTGPSAADNRIVNSTITNNTADTVGGLYTNLATLEFVTVSHNAATVPIMPRQAMFNSRGLAENPGGAALSGDVEVVSSLFSDNLSPGGTIDLSIESPGTLTVDYSLVETPGIGVGGGTGNLLNVDPQLEPLALNGGATATRALEPGSPAIDTGTPSTFLTSDQRGEPYPRVFNGRADMGAFEFFVDAIFADRFEQP